MWHCAVHDRVKAVSVEKFGEHVQRMHADRDKWFELEYNVSQTSGLDNSCHHALHTNCLCYVRRL